MAFDLGIDRNVQDSNITGQSFAAPLTPPDLSRADIADYLAKSNYDPVKAKALATHETLTNLGVDPDHVAQTVNSTIAQATTLPAPAQPRPALNAAPAAPRALTPATAATSRAPSPQSVPVRPVIAKPATPKPIDFSDLGGRRVDAAPSGTIDFSDLGGKRVGVAPTGGIDFSDLGGRRVEAPSTLADTSPRIDISAGLVPKAPSPKTSGIDLSAGFVPNTAPMTDTSPMGEPPKSQSEPDSNGALHQIGGFLQGAGENVAGAVKGVHDLFQEPQNDDEKDVQQKVMIGNHGELGGRLALAGYRFLHGINDTLNQMDEAGKLGAKEQKESGSTAAGFVTDMENEPFIGKATKLAEQGEYGKALGDILTSIAMLRAGGKAKAAEGAIEPIEGAPLTAGEAAGPGLRQGAEKLFSKTSTAQNRMSDVMGERTAAMQSAARKISPQAGTPELAGEEVQDAARDVLDRQGQAQSLVGDLANRAKGEAETARTAATEKAGTEAQQTATEKLNQRRTADIEGAKTTARAISGADELPVPETDREIISSLRGANSAAKAEESAAHNELAENAKAKGITVDTAPMQSVAKEVVGLEGPARDLVMSSLPASVYKTLERVAARTSGESDVIASRAKDFGWDASQLTDSQLSQLKKDIADHPSVASDPGSNAPVPYDVMKTARSAVGEALQSARKHFQQTGLGSNAMRTLQQLYGGMTEGMKNAVSGDPELSAQFEKANALTRERASTFTDPKAIRKLVYADDPGKVIGSVMRSGSDADVGALRTALDADKTGQGLARAQRGAMDYVLRKSMKSPTSDLPSGVRPDAIDYETALRNAKGSTALRALLGDDKYNTFVKDIDSKRLAQRSPDEINLDNQLTKIAKADSPEKAAKVAGYDAGTDAGVNAAEQKATNAAAIRDRMQSPTTTEAGPQKVAEQVANELEPSKIITHAAESPEYADKLLTVLDKHPNAKTLRETLGQRIFRNASDGAMVRGAFGSSDGVFDVEKFQSQYAAVRPSLAKVLPTENLAAMDRFNEALNKYVLSKGVGGVGMSGKFMAMRQIFGVLSMARGVLSGSPSSFALGAAASFGPRLWMEIATRPQFAAAVTKALSTGTKVAGTTSEVAAQAPERKSSGTGFQRPEMEEHKTAGMAAAAEAPKTPDHLRPHLRKLAGSFAPAKGSAVTLPDGRSATVEYSSPDDKLPVVKVRTSDGKVIRYTRKKEIDALTPSGDVGPQSTDHQI